MASVESDRVYSKEGESAASFQVLQLDSVQLTREAIERNEGKRVAFRYDYGIRFTPEQTIFVDESSFDRRTSIRGRAWAVRGERASRGVFFVRGKRYAQILLAV